MHSLITNKTFPGYTKKNFEYGSKLSNLQSSQSEQTHSEQFDSGQSTLFFV